MKNEPMYTTGARTTATSANEGRMKVGLSRKKKNSILRTKLDGKGGCGSKKNY
jgi:hypothetical protein